MGIQISTAVSVAAFTVSVVALLVAYTQMRIASAKTRLDLYSKRFNIYADTLSYYQAIWHGTIDDMHENAIAFTKSYRESQFLFDPKDGIYESLGIIQACGGTICMYEQMKDDKSKLAAGVSHNSGDLSVMRTSSIQAQEQFSEALLKLETQVGRYIAFHSVRGWRYFKDN